MAVAFCQRKCTGQQMFEIVLDLKWFSPGAARKRRRIKNNRVKFLTSSGQSRQYRPHIVGDEAMVDGPEVVQPEIFAAARKVFFGDVYIKGNRSAGRGAHGKRACVSKTIQQSFGSDMTHVPAVFSLVEKQTGRITGREVDAEIQMPFGGDCL